MSRMTTARFVQLRRMHDEPYHAIGCEMLDEVAMSWRDRDRLAAELLAAKADGMPSDRDALQALLDSAYNKGRDDVHALYQTGAPIALIQAQLLAVREELGRAHNALREIVKVRYGLDITDTDEERANYWFRQCEMFKRLARSALTQPTKTGGG